MLKNLIRSFFIFYSVVGTGSFAYADLSHRNIPLFQPRRLQIGNEIQYFQSNSNYLDNGTKETFPASFKFLTYDIVLNSMYDLTDEWAVSADLGLAYAESFNNVDLRNSRKIKDLKLGVFRLYETESFGRFIVDGYYLMSLVDNGVNKDEVSVGDGVSWLQGGVWWEPGKHRVKKTNSYEKFSTPSAFQPNLRTYMGFRTRSELSDVLIYKIHPQFKYKKFVFGGELNGTLSVFKDAAANKVKRALINQYNASSSRYNAWNPNILELMAWAGYQPKPYSQLRFGVSQVVGLENTADGFGLFFDWQTSMTVTSSGMIFSNFFDGSNSANPRKNNDMKIKDYGPEPKKEPKIVPSNLEDL